MRIFITAGNTQVLLDRVRCITNIFTGRTGAGIALEAYRRGHYVTLATSHPETVETLRGPLPLDVRRWLCHSYRTFEELETLMRRQVVHERVDGIVHSAAVSDYRSAGIYAPSATTHFHADDLSWRAGEPGPPTLRDRAAGKIKSDEPELWLRLVRTPKLVDYIRSAWNFSGILVKFKLEVGLAEDDLRDLAERSRQQSSADWMVANTLEGAAEWALLGDARGYRKVARAELPIALLDQIENQYQESQRG
jgi:phosphopantothenate---cysteine ligase (CTP)